MSRVSVTWDFLLSTLFKDAERMQIECAIGALLHDREEGLKRNYLIYGPPASGKSTILNYISKIFENDPDVIIVHDADPNKLAELEMRYPPEATIFAASNAKPKAELETWIYIKTRDKSKPLDLKVYQQICETLDESIIEIKYDCEMSYILQMRAFNSILQKLKKFNERKTEE